MRTPAESAVAAEALRLLGDNTKWRVVAVIATYKKPSDGELDVNITNAVAMRSKEAALDYVMLIKRLRTLADELEQVAKGERPLPPQEG